MVTEPPVSSSLVAAGVEALRRLVCAWVEAIERECVDNPDDPWCDPFHGI